MMYGYGYDGFLWHGILGPFGMILFWGAVIFVIVWLVKDINKKRPDDAGAKTALDILKERYAKGEIDRAEFEAKKKDIN